MQAEMHRTPHYQGGQEDLTSSRFIPQRPAFAAHRLRAISAARCTGTPWDALKPRCWDQSWDLRIEIASALRAYVWVLLDSFSYHDHATPRVLRNVRAALVMAEL